MVKNKNHPGAGWSLFETTSWLYFQSLGGRMLLPAVVPLDLEFLFLLTSVGKRPFGDIFLEKYFLRAHGIAGGAVRCAAKLLKIQMFRWNLRCPQASFIHTKASC